MHWLFLSSDTPLVPERCRIRAPGVAWTQGLTDAPRPDSLAIVVLPASRVRLARVRLPRVAADRLPAAVAFALEDQLAGPLEAQHVVPTNTSTDGELVAAVCDAAWLRATLDAVRSFGWRPVAAVASPHAIVVPPDTWVWLVGRDGFVATADGWGTPIDGEPADGIPPLLASLLQTAIANGDAPRHLHVVRTGSADFGDDVLNNLRAALADLQIDVSSPQRAWVDSAPLIQGPSNLLVGNFAVGPAQPARNQSWRTAGWLIAAALALQGGALAAGWGSVALQHWRLGRAEAALLAKAGLPADRGIEALRNHARTLRHQTGRTTPDDALPLLAAWTEVHTTQALPSPSRIRWTDGSLLIDYPTLPPASATTLTAAGRRAGLTVLTANDGGSTRIRIVPLL